MYKRPRVSLRTWQQTAGMRRAETH